MEPITPVTVASDFYRLSIALLVFCNLAQAIYLVMQAVRNRGVRREELDELKGEIDERLSRLSEKITSSNDSNQALFRDILSAIGELKGRLPRS